jgi:hypothetical protein
VYLLLQTPLSRTALGDEDTEDTLYSSNGVEDAEPIPCSVATLLSMNSAKYGCKYDINDITL